MVKSSSRCTVCNAIKADPALGRRLSISKAYVASGESLLSILRDRPDITKKSIYNHVKKHQAPSKAKLEKKVKQFESKEAYKEIVAETEGRSVAVYTNHNDARRTLLERGLEALDSGDMKLTGSVMAQLLKQESDIEEKSKDRSLELMKMFNYFASGSGKPQLRQPNRTIIEAQVD